MNRLLQSLAAAVLLAHGALSAAPASALPSQLSLRQAKDIALRDNPDLLVTQARIQAAAARLREARAGYLPSVSLTADATRQLDYARQNRRDAHRDAMSSFSAGIEATYTLFEGFATQLEVSAQRLALDIAQSNHADAQRQLLLAVATAYYTALLERQNVIIAVEDQKYNEQLQQNAEKKLRRGSGTRSDVLNFEIQAKMADANRILAEVNYDTAILALAELLSVPPESIPKDLALDSVQDYLKASPRPSAEQLRQYAYENRPDLQALDATIRRCQDLADQQRADYYPTLSAFGAYGFSRDHSPAFRNVNDEAQIGLRLSWNIFSGGATQARVAQANADRMEAEASRTSLRQAIASDIATQLNIIAQARRLADLKNATMLVAQRARDLVQKEYENGRVTATRLNEAQTDLTSAKGAYIKAVINYWQYRQNLDSTTAHILNAADDHL